MNLQEVSFSQQTVLRYVVPFYFSASGTQSAALSHERLAYEELIGSLSGNADWHRDSMDRRERDVYDYIWRSVLAENGDTEIGCSYRYRDKGSRIPLRYCPSSDEESYDFYITQVGLFLFKTNVGFLWYEIQAPKKKGELIHAEALISFQNRFKELYRPHAGYQFLQRTGKDQYVLFVPGLWVNRLLGDISPQIRFLSQRSTSATGEQVADKALLFNLLLFESPGQHSWEGLCSLAYSLSNGYTSRYRMSQQSMGGMMQPFADVCWYASKDGCGYYAFLNEENRDYFDGSMSTKVRDDYFLLYILALHQSYSLMNYLRRMSCEFSADPEQYVIPSGKGEQLDVFAAELNTFLMKGMYLSVSNIEHQNLFFQMLQSSLRIREDMESIQMGLGALMKLQRIKKEKDDQLREREAQALKEAERDRQENSDHQLSFYGFLLALFAVFSAVMDGTALLDYVKEYFSENTFSSVEQLGHYLWNEMPWSLAYILLFGIGVSLFVLAGVLMIRTARQTKRKKPKKKK